MSCAVRRAVYGFAGAQAERIDDREYPRAALWRSVPSLSPKLAHHLREVGMHVAQSVHVEDTEKGKALEIDIVAAHQERQARLEVVVECKTLAEPWVGFATPPRPGHPLDGCAQLPHTAEVEQACGSSLEAVRENLDWEGDPVVQLRPLRPPEKQREPEDAYLLLKGLATKCLGRRDALAGKVAVARILPVLVVDGALAEAQWYPEASDFVVSAAQTLQLGWSGAPGWESHFMFVTVVSRSHFPDLAKKLAAWTKDWCRATHAAHEKLQRRQAKAEE